MVNLNNFVGKLRENTRLPVTAIVPSRDMSKQVIAIVCGFLDNDDGCLLIDCVLLIFLKFQ